MRIVVTAVGRLKDLGRGRNGIAVEAVSVYQQSYGQMYVYTPFAGRRPASRSCLRVFASQDRWK